MKSIIAIALNTFREAVRNRILYIILIFALMLVASSGIVSDLSISANDRVVRDFGLACISLFGLAVAILVGITLVYNELDKKTIYTIVSKPITRWQFLLGKYFGLLLTIYVNLLIMSVFFLGMIHYQENTTYEAIDAVIWSVDGEGNDVLADNYKMVIAMHHAKSFVVGLGKGFLNLAGLQLIDETRHLNAILFLIALELAMVTAFAILFSSFSTPTLSAILTLLVFIAGRLNQDIWAYAQKLGEAGAMGSIGGNIKYYLAMGACHVAPNLGAFKVGTLSLNEAGPLKVDWLVTVPYSLAYSACILSISIMIFRSRNFK